MTPQHYTNKEVAKLFLVRETTPREAVCRDGHWMGIRPIKLPTRRLLWPKDQVDAVLSGEPIPNND